MKDADLIDWKEMTMKILTCFGECEGTWYEREWESYGISKAEAAVIKEEADKYYEAITRPPTV